MKAFDNGLLQHFSPSVKGQYEATNDLINSNNINIPETPNSDSADPGEYNVTPYNQYDD